MGTQKLKNFILTETRTIEFKAKDMTEAIESANWLEDFDVVEKYLVCEETGEEEYL